MKTSELEAHLQPHWEKIRAKLLAGTYVPSPVKRVEIPRPSGGTRMLGVPTGLDLSRKMALARRRQTPPCQSLPGLSLPFTPQPPVLTPCNQHLSPAFSDDANQPEGNADQRKRAWLWDLRQTVRLEVEIVKSRRNRRVPISGHREKELRRSRPGGCA